MPGIFLVSLLILGSSMYFHKDNLDERYWLPIFLTVGVTIASWLYFLFLQVTNNIPFIKGANWVPIILIGTLTVLSIMNALSLRLKVDVKSPEDYALKCTVMESISGVLLWAWFTLFWNTRYSTQLLTIPPSFVRKTNNLLPNKEDIPTLKDPDDFG